MDIKGGTKTWSDAPQTSGLKADTATQLLSADERQQALGDQDLGKVLNKVADPNWVDPAKMRKVGNSQLDKDAFMKLMLAQMKNQDPTNPMQSHEMAAQLAQFTSLEQLSNINTTLTGMQKTQTPMTNYQALNFIGKRVSGDSSKVLRATGDTNHDFNFDLGADAAKVNVLVKDADGNTVRKMEFSNLKKGANSVTWNGLDDDSNASRAGEYRMVVEANSSNGRKVAARTEFEGRITGLNYTPEGPVLMVGNQSVRLGDVKKIEEATASDLSAPVSAPIPLKSGGQSGAKTIPIPGAPPESAGVGNIESVPMARGLLEQVTSVKN